MAETPRTGWLYESADGWWNAFSVLTPPLESSETVPVVVLPVADYAALTAKRDRMRMALVSIARHGALPEPCSLKCLDHVIWEARAALGEDDAT